MLIQSDQPASIDQHDLPNRAEQKNIQSILQCKRKVNMEIEL